MFLHDRYDYYTNSSFLDYEFVSEGPNRAIRKVARFTKIKKDFTILGWAI